MMVQRVRGLGVGLAGFVIALVGFIIGFSGFQFDMRWLSVGGFFITLTGVFVGFVGIIYGWLTEGSKAIIGSGKAMRDLSANVIHFLKINTRKKGTLPFKDKKE